MTVDGVGGRIVQVNSSQLAVLSSVPSGKKACIVLFLLSSPLSTNALNNFPFAF
jgi:hypothetical protein